MPSLQGQPTAQPDRAELESEKYPATVRLSWDHKRKVWLLTAFDYTKPPFSKGRSFVPGDPEPGGETGPSPKGGQSPLPGGLTSPPSGGAPPLNIPSGESELKGGEVAWRRGSCARIFQRFYDHWPKTGF